MRRYIQKSKRKNVRRFFIVGSMSVALVSYQHITLTAAYAAPSCMPDPCPGCAQLKETAVNNIGCLNSEQEDLKDELESKGLTESQSQELTAAVYDREFWGNFCALNPSDVDCTASKQTDRETNYNTKIESLKSVSTDPTAVQNLTDEMETNVDEVAQNVNQHNEASNDEADCASGGGDCDPSSGLPEKNWGPPPV